MGLVRIYAITSSKASAPRARVAILTLLSLALLSFAPAASAQDATSDPGVDEYAETVPTSSGGRLTSGGGDGTPQTQSTLPPSVAGKIENEGGKDADLLEKIASSPRYGSPGATVSAGAQSSEGAVKGPGPLAAAADAAGDGGMPMVVLLVVVGLIGAAATATAVIRRGARRS